ncbi:MAG TPA: glycosyltransferase, partial [Candidatus Caenarcaniphilales bacterium]
TGKKVLMFAAATLNEFRKGGDLLLKALSSLPAALKAETVLLIMGKGGSAIAQTLGMQTINLEYVSSDYLKAIAYSAADLFIFPTRGDIFGLVSIESQACGTPVVAFRVCGVPDHVRPGVTGYLAEPENASDLGQGIVQLLEDEALRHRMRHQCREIAVKEYAIELQAQRYLALYHQLQRAVQPRAKGVPAPV